jgi:hypothetical protein
VSRIPIDPASWATFNRLLDEALDLPPADRERWLDALPAEHAGLKPHLHDLLVRVPAAMADSLDTRPKIDRGTPVGDAAVNRLGLVAGDLVGPYRLVREIATGGMGVVWLASRGDEMIKRPVALKLPRGSWERPALAGRMARERVILEKVSGSNRDRTLGTRIFRAQALGMLGRLDGAKNELTASLQAAQSDGTRRRALFALGMIERLSGRPAEGREHQRAALELIAAGGGTPRDRMLALAEIGIDEIDLRLAAAAESTLRGAHALFDRLQPLPTPARADAQVARGRALMETGNLDEAAVLLRRADSFWTASGPDNRWAGEAAFWLGQFLPTRRRRVRGARCGRARRSGRRGRGR